MTLNRRAWPRAQFTACFGLYRVVFIIYKRGNIRGMIFVNHQQRNLSVAEICNGWHFLLAKVWHEMKYCTYIGEDIHIVIRSSDIYIIIYIYSNGQYYKIGVQWYLYEQYT